MRRGYQGRKPEQTEQSILESFYHMMKRKSDTFDSKRAEFRLKAKPSTGATSA